MPKYIAPRTGETRKAYIHRAYGIGKGSGKGRISAEGHERIAEAIAKGHQFPDLLAAAAPKVAKEKKAAAPKKPVIEIAQKAEARAVDPAAIREWARKNGIAVSERGRIAAEVTLRYLAEVPVNKRDARAGTNGEKDLRAPAPRTSPEGTKWRVDFTYRGEAVTMVVSDRTVCGTCGVSLGWHQCRTPRIATGYGDTETGQRISVIEPKE